MSRFFRRKRFCRFSAEGVDEIDYKDLNLLKQYLSETGKINLAPFSQFIILSTDPVLLGFSVGPGPHGVKDTLRHASRNGATSRPSASTTPSGPACRSA